MQGPGQVSHGGEAEIGTIYPRINVSGSRQFGHLARIGPNRWSHPGRRLTKWQAMPLRL